MSILTCSVPLLFNVKITLLRRMKDKYVHPAIEFFWKLLPWTVRLPRLHLEINEHGFIIPCPFSLPEAKKDYSYWSSCHFNTDSMKFSLVWIYRLEGVKVRSVIHIFPRFASQNIFVINFLVGNARSIELHFFSLE